jgi:hypothetical protein
VEGNDPHGGHGYMCGGDTAGVGVRRVSHRMAEIKILCFSGCLLSLGYPPMKMEQTECSETLAYKIQTPGNYPEESIQ